MDPWATPQQIVCGEEHWHATYTVVFEFVKQNIMIDGIKGLRKIKENPNGMFIAIKSKGDFFI